jgi:hypothetical protein
LHHAHVKKDVSRSSENDRSSSFPLQKAKKPTSRSAKGDLLSQKTDIRKPVCRNGEDPDCSSHTEPFENPVCNKGEDVGLSPEKLVDEPISRYGDDLDHSCQKESSRQPICRDGQDDLGYSCDEEIVEKSDCVNSQDALGSNVSPGTIVSAGNGSDGLSVSQANGAEPPECALANGCSDKDISSPVEEVRSEKTDDVSGTFFSQLPSTEVELSVEDLKSHNIYYIIGRLSLTISSSELCEVTRTDQLAIYLLSSFAGYLLRVIQVFALVLKMLYDYPYILLSFFRNAYLAVPSHLDELHLITLT